MLPKELQDAINSLPKETQLLFELVVSYYEKQVSDLEARVKNLEDQISKNSKNSSKPPSTDEFKKPPKSIRNLGKKTKRQQGGQKGHEGTTLKIVATPDQIIDYQLDFCECCNKDIRSQKIDSIERRQVYDIPPIKMEIIEHRSEVKTCSCGHLNKAFPKGIERYVQYGPRIKAMMVYLQDYQLLPYHRTKEFVQDFFNHQLSTGTLYNFRKHAYQQLEPFEERLKNLLTYCVVAGFDETGFRVMTQRLWLHSCSTPKHAYYEVHQKRGKKAMNDIGILPAFRGIAVHDFWKSYYTYACQHALCNAHLLRDLIFIKERFEQEWANELIQLLLKMKAAKEKAIAKNKLNFSKATLKKYRHQFDAIISKGLKQNPIQPPLVKSRGRYKKTPPQNLLERLNDFSDDVLRFFFDFNVPFDNNFSERDIRMMKVKQKISGCFRSLTGAEYFARIRSYIITARKQNLKVFKAMTNLFTDNSIPISLTST